ncbi:MAG: tyrosine-type recombinase/integrase [Anaerolineaceae bacterium]|nr:tyrosine-type recombinase/integrase [Anaerolineaceae bacterium]
MKNQTESTSNFSVINAVNAFIDSITYSRSENTAKTYRNGMKFLLFVLNENEINPEEFPVSDISEEPIIWIAAALKNHAPTTESLYLSAVSQFYEYLIAEDLASINMSRVKMLIKQRGRKPGIRLPQFPRKAIEDMIQFANGLKEITAQSEAERLRNFRDRAFLISLADTGLRVHEACGLRRGDIDWNEGRAIIIGKGNREAVIRFSSRALRAIKDYLDVRAPLDGISGRPLRSLPLFARHDKGAGKKIKPISTTTGRNIVSQRVKECLGPEHAGSITPHSFRHYFVTTVVLGSGDIKLAQELARHKNIAVTTRYTHLSDDELDKGYWEIFENK